MPRTRCVGRTKYERLRPVGQGRASGAQMAAVPPRHVVSTTTHVPMMLALTFSTGIVDAVGYLGLDRVFTGNMTGNVVILGMALVGGDDLPIVGPLIALGGFMAGAAIAGRALHDHAAGWATRTTVLFGLVAGLMAAIALTFVVDPEPAHALALTVTGFLGGAMGSAGRGRPAHRGQGRHHGRRHLHHHGARGRHTPARRQQCVEAPRCRGAAHPGRRSGRGAPAEVAPRRRPRARCADLRGGRGRRAP